MRTDAHPVLWAPDDLLAAHDAWLAGWGDLPFASRRRPVPPMVQLGVLAHAGWQRLDDLRGAGTAGRAATTWGPATLRLVDVLLRTVASPAGLAALQHRTLEPLERQLLDAGRMDLSAADLVDLLQHVLSPDQAWRSG